jgi:hypothetical protein
MLSEGVYIGPVKKKGRPARIVNTTTAPTDQAAVRNATTSLDSKAQPSEPPKGEYCFLVLDSKLISLLDW